jgi:hypothetical protein
MFTKPTYKKTKKQIGNIRDRIKRKLGKGRGEERREREGEEREERGGGGSEGGGVGGDSAATEGDKYGER